MTIGQVKEMKYDILWDKTRDEIFELLPFAIRAQHPRANAWVKDKLIWEHLSDEARYAMSLGGNVEMTLSEYGGFCKLHRKPPQG